MCCLSQLCSRLLTMDFSVFSSKDSKKKQTKEPPPPSAPAAAPASLPPSPRGASQPQPPAPTPPARLDRPPRIPGFIPEIMRRLPKVPGSRSVEMTFRLDFGDPTDDYYDHPNNHGYGPPIRSMPAAPSRHMAPPLAPEHQYNMPRGLPVPPHRGMHGHAYYGPPPRSHNGYHHHGYFG